MKRNKILGALKNADRPLTIQELSKKIDIPVSSLRIDLYRLQEEGEIENRDEGGELKWKVKVSKPIEEKYKKMSEGYSS